MPRNKRFKVALSVADDSNATLDSSCSLPSNHGVSHSVTLTHSGGAHCVPSEAAHSSEAAQSSDATHSNQSSDATHSNLDASVPVPPPASASGRPVTSGHRNKSYWNVGVIDAQGTIKEARLKVQDIWSLPNNKKVVITCNDEGQPIGEAGGLLGGFLGELGANFSMFPISYRSWPNIPRMYKERLFANVVEKKLHLENSRTKGYILRNIGKKWKDNRCKLFHEFYDPTLSREANIAKHPQGINHDQWAVFIDYRLQKKTLEQCKKNAENRQKQTIPHTGGSKSLPRRKAEEESQRGSCISRGELWNVTHKRKDGSYVNEEARTIGEKISEIEQQDSSTQCLSQKDSLAQVFGKEHPGRVRGLGFGLSPSQIFGHTTHQISGMSLSTPASQLRNEIQQLTSKLEAETLMRRSMESKLEIETQMRQSIESELATMRGAMTYLFQQYGGVMPAEFASKMVPEEGSGSVSPGARPSSSASFDGHNPQNLDPRKK